jgi:hypothetical protein
MALHPSAARPRIPNSRRPFASARRPKPRSSSLQPPASDFRGLIGTPQRLRTHLSYRKQTIGSPPNPPNRYSSRLPDSRPRGPSRVVILSPSQRTKNPSSYELSQNRLPATASRQRNGLHTNYARLPETANRVETHVSYRKQTIATCSTRDGTRASSHEGLIAPSKAACGGILRRSSSDRLRMTPFLETAARDLGTGVGGTPRSCASFERLHPSANPRRTQFEFVTTRTRRKDERTVKSALRRRSLDNVTRCTRRRLQSPWHTAVNDGERAELLTVRDRATVGTFIL